jgi:predicted RNase H-like HicB family nuclease
MEVHTRNLDVSKHNVKKHLSHALDISCSNSGMDIYSNRRRWLAHWIDTEYSGNKARAAEATGYSRSQISQFLSDTYQEGRSPQEKAARTIERKFKKPDRIMETPAPGTVADAPSPALQPASGQTPTDLAYVTRDGAVVVIELKDVSRDGETVEEALKRSESQAVEYLKSLPDYVVSAHKAVSNAYQANAPRETFDAITVLFSQLLARESGTIVPPTKDETVKSPSAMQSIKDQAERAQRDAESRLATRNEEPRAARRSGEKRQKNIRH